MHFLKFSFNSESFIICTSTFKSSHLCLYHRNLMKVRFLNSGNLSSNGISARSPSRFHSKVCASITCHIHIFRSSRLTIIICHKSLMNYSVLQIRWPSNQGTIVLIETVYESLWRIFSVYQSSIRYGLTLELVLYVDSSRIGFTKV